MGAYFDLERSFAFYGAYHDNFANKVIHIICVPLIFISSIDLLARMTPIAVPNCVFLFYAISFIIMEPVSGLMYFPILCMYYWIGTMVLSEYTYLSLVLFSTSWIAQFLGHGIFERRAPALLTNLPQSLHTAVFFVWLELLFIVGYKPQLHDKLRRAVSRQRISLKFQ
jgi:uncharacterized membrane protein YGL010W